MASDNEASCESDPNFAVICAFMEKFGATCGLASIDFLELQEMLENTQEVPQELIDLHIKLLRKSRKTVSNERWEKAVIKFCHSFCVQDAWEIERFGYKKARLSSKLRVLKELLEMQFDYNARFKAEINKMSAEELRSQPLGKDKHGHAYWIQNDNNCQIRVYKEDPDEETWTLVAKDRDGLVALITELSNGDADSKAIAEAALNEEDSNSLVEKPIIDTGQVDSSSSDSNKKSVDESDNSNESRKAEEEEEEESVEEEEAEEEEKKRPLDEMEEEAAAKRPKMEEVVGEAVEEPMMLVKGEGEGVENECENPIVGEEIEEDLMYFYGNGNGVDCETGNEDETKKNEQQQNASAVSDVSGESSENCVSISSDVVDAPARSEVPTSHVKIPFKLGTIIDTKTDNKIFNSARSPTKKASRWDVETIMAKEPSPEVAATPPKKAMFFFGPGCMQFKPSPSPSATVAFGQKVPQTEGVEEPAANVDEESTTVEEAEVRSAVEEEKSDVGYRIEATKNSVETSECVQSIGEAVGQTNDDEVSDEKVEGTLLVDQQTPLLESRIEDKLVEVSSDKIEETKASQVVHVDQELESSQEISKTEDKEETLETRKCEETPVKDEEQDVVSTEVTLELKKSEETPVKDQEQDVVSTEVTLELKKSEETPVKDEEQEVVSTEVTLELKKGEETPVKDEEQDVVLTEVTLEPKKSEEAPVKDEEQDVVSTEVTLEPKKSEEIPVEPVKGQEQGAVMTEVEKSTEYEEIPTQPVNVQEQEVISAEVRKSTECEEFEEKSAPESLKNEENEGKMEEPGVELTQNIENEGKEETNEEELTKETEGAENVSVPEPKESTQSEEKNEETNMEHLKSEDKQELGVTLREEHPINEEQPECIEKDADLAMEVTRPNENEEKKEESEVKLTESDENTEEKEKDSTIELPKSIPSEEKEESVAQITQPEEKDDDEIEPKLIETEAKSEEVTTKDENERIPIEVSSEKTENDVSSQKNDDEVSLEKTEDVEMGEIEEKKPKVEKETEVAPALSEIEKQIVSEENKFCDLNTEQNIPEVTAALVQYEEKLEERVEEFKETDLITNNSCVVEHQKQEETEEKQPVAEEECVKKHSYILGEETEKEKLEEHVEDEKPNDKPESADSETVETLASENLEENEDTQKVGEEPITEPQTSTPPPPLTSREEDIPKVLDVAEEKPVITEKKETTATVEDDKLPIEEKPNCSMAAKQEPISDEIKETVICSSVKNELDVKQKEPSPPSRSVEENVADAVKENVVDTVKTKKEPTNNNNKGVRGRRNNVSTDQPKIFTRRTTRSSRSDETRLVEEKPSDLEVSTAKEDKKPETTSPKTEEQPTTVVQPRRGRSRGMAKAEKEETPEVDTSKKIKLSEEAREETETKPTTRRNKMMKENAIQEEKKEEMAVEEAKPEQPLPEVVTVESGNSNDVMDGPEKDPLAVSEEETTVKLSEEKKPMSLATFSLDFHESPAPPVTRSGLRKRGRESPPNCEEIEETAGKRLKKGKRNVDVKLRKSIEEQKKQELISSDDDKQQQNEEAKNLKKRAGKNKKVDQAKNEESVVVSSDAEAETPTKEAEPAQKKTKTVNKNKRLLSNLGINPDQPLKFEEGATIGVRQSRRIAQLKIKEEAERRKLEEEMALEQQHTQKKKKSKKSEDKIMMK